MNIHKEAAKAALIWGLLLILMLFTRPGSMPVYLLALPFIILGFATYSVWRLLVLVYTRSGKKHAVLSSRQRAAGIAISLVSVVITGLQSIGEMSSRDIITVALFAVGAYFYFVRNLIRE